MRGWSRISSSLSLAVALVACQNTTTSHLGLGGVEPAFRVAAGKPVPDLPGEPCLRNVRQLTFGGENAEAYWSNDGRKLVFQSTRPPYECDQILVLDLASGATEMVSTGKGRTTCGYFLQGDQRILYSSTHLADEACPERVFRVDGRYVWAIYPSYDIFTARPDGSDVQRLTSTPGYDAEATVCPVTGRIVFTSVRDGDLEIYSMEPDGSDLMRLTRRVGYDGGPFFSHDGSKIVLRSGFLDTEEATAEYVGFLRKGLVVPTALEITVMNRDGSGFRRVTDNGKANFAPYFHPDDRRIVFASNQNDPKGRDFDIYIIGTDGQNQIRLTNNPTFDGFPMFSPDGRYLAFASNRFAGAEGETNLFVAEWVEPQPE
jgi:Tol biopolymer transport system component